MIITFYSFKGGVGRTTALASFAIPETLLNQLRELARAEGTSVSAIIRQAVRTLLEQKVANG